MKKIVVSLLVAIAAITGSQKSEAAEITVSYGGYTAMDACGYYKASTQPGVPSARLHISL